MIQEEFERASATLANKPGIWKDIPDEASVLVEMLGTSIADDMGWEYAIDPKDFSFNWVDSEMLSYFEEPTPPLEVTDDLRVAFARSELNLSADELQSDLWSGVHAYELNGDNGNIAYLCATSMVIGYEPQIDYCGVFTAKTEFLEYLKRCGLWLLSDVPSLTDAQILRYWDSA